MLRRMLAIAACRALILAGKLAGKKSSSTPGRIAMKIDPTLLRHLAAQVKREIIAVCGTNGKTTTTNLLDTLLKNAGYRVVCNNVGANMLDGVANAFISMASLTGKLNADYAALECDEASLRHVVNHVKANKIILTNLFRDQMDRYGETEITAELLREAFVKLPDATLIINADDPLCAQFTRDFSCISYGISEDCNTQSAQTDEGRFCVFCGKELHYDYHHYSQLGSFSCPDCGFTRPTPDYSAQQVDLTNGLAFDVCYHGEKRRLDLHYRGFYNIYNVLASFAAYDALGLPADGIDAVFNAYKPQIGRMEEFNIGGKTVILNLAKNPAGFNQAIATVATDPRPKDVLIAVNDKPSDGTDVTWLWDVDFETLGQANVTEISAGGIRMHDVALRLKYAGFDDVSLAECDRASLQTIISGSGEVCYLLVNYTVLFSVQSDLQALEKSTGKEN